MAGSITTDLSGIKNSLLSELREIRKEVQKESEKIGESIGQGIEDGFEDSWDDVIEVVQKSEKELIKELNKAQKAYEKNVAKLPEALSKAIKSLDFRDVSKITRRMATALDNVKDTMVELSLIGADVDNNWFSNMEAQMKTLNIMNEKEEERLSTIKETTKAIQRQNKIYTSSLGQKDKTFVKNEQTKKLAIGKTTNELEHLIDSLIKLDSIGAKPLNQIIESIVSSKTKISSEVQEILKSLNLLNDKGKLSGNFIAQGSNNIGVVTNDRYAIIAREPEVYSDFDDIGYGKGKDEYIDVLIQKEKEAINQGVNLARVLDVIKLKDVFYEIQELAPGKSLPNFDFDQSEDALHRFEQSCAKIIGATDEHIHKLFEDIQKLNKLGFMIDFNPGNILYDAAKGFTIIDLQLADLGAEVKSTEYLMEGFFECLTGFVEQEDNIVPGAANVDKWISSMGAVYQKLINVFSKNNFGVDVGRVTQHIGQHLGVIDSTTKSREKQLKLTKIRNDKGGFVPQSYTAVDGKYEIYKGAVGWNVYQPDEYGGFGELISTYETLKELRLDSNLIAEQEALTQKKLTEATKDAISTQKEYYAMSREDATNYLFANYDKKLWDEWFLHGSDSARSEIAKKLESDSKLRNASLNQMWNVFKEQNGSDISYEDFLNSKIPLYRGERVNDGFGGVVPKSVTEIAASFSLSADIAKDFANQLDTRLGEVLEIFISPKDTLGMPRPKNYGETGESYGEIEILVPMNQISGSSEYLNFQQNLNEKRERYLANKDVKEVHKLITSYEELCEVVAKYNELATKDIHRTVDEDYEYYALDSRITETASQQNIPLGKLWDTFNPGGGYNTEKLSKLIDLQASAQIEEENEKRKLVGQEVQKFGVYLEENFERITKLSGGLNEYNLLMNEVSKGAMTAADAIEQLNGVLVKTVSPLDAYQSSFSAKEMKSILKGIDIDGIAKTFNIVGEERKALAVELEKLASMTAEFEMRPDSAEGGLHEQQFNKVVQMIIAKGKHSEKTEKKFDKFLQYIDGSIIKYTDEDVAEFDPADWDRLFKRFGVARGKRPALLSKDVGYDVNGDWEEMVKYLGLAESGNNKPEFGAIKVNTTNKHDQVKQFIETLELAYDEKATYRKNVFEDLNQSDTKEVQGEVHSLIGQVYDNAAKMIEKTAIAEEKVVQAAEKQYNVKRRVLAENNQLVQTEKRLAQAAKETASAMDDQDKATTIPDIKEKDIEKSLKQLRDAKNNQTSLVDLSGVYDSKDLTTQMHTMATSAIDADGYVVDKIKVKDSVAMVKLYNDELKTTVTQTYQMSAAAEGAESSLELVSEAIEQNVKALQKSEFDINFERKFANTRIDNLINPLGSHKYSGESDLKTLANDIVDEVSLKNFEKEFKNAKTAVSTLKQQLDSDFNTTNKMSKWMDQASVQIKLYRSEIEKLGDVQGVSTLNKHLEAMGKATHDYFNTDDLEKQVEAYARYDKAKKAFESNIKLVKNQQKTQAAEQKNFDASIKSYYTTIKDAVSQISTLDSKINSLKLKDDGSGVLTPLIRSLENEKSVLLNKINTIGDQIGQTFKQEFQQGATIDFSFFNIEGEGLHFDKIYKFFNDTRVQAALTEKDISSLSTVFSKMQNNALEFSIALKEKISEVNNMDELLKSMTSTDSIDKNNALYQAAVGKKNAFQETLTRLQSQYGSDMSLWDGAATQEFFNAYNEAMKYMTALKQVIQTEAQYFRGKKEYTSSSDAYNTFNEKGIVEYKKQADEVASAKERLSEAANQFAKEFDGSSAIIKSFTTNADGVSKLDFSVLDKSTNSLRQFTLETGTLDQKLYVTENSIDKTLQKIKNAEQQMHKMDGLLQTLELNGFDISSDNAHSSVTRLLNLTQQLSAALATGDTTKIDEIMQDAKLATSEVQKLYNESIKLKNAIDDGQTKNLGAYIDDKDIAAYDQLSAAVRKHAADVDGASLKVGKFDEANNKLHYTITNADGTVDHFTASINQLGKTIDTQHKGTTKLKTGFQDLTSMLSYSAKQMLVAFSGYNIFSRAIQTVRQGVTYIKEIDSALTELKKVTDETQKSYEVFLSTAAETGKKIGATVSDYVNATADFARLGYDMNSAGEMAQAAIVYKNVADGLNSIEESTESITSTMKAFGIESNDTMGIIDSFNEVGNNFAITSAGIGEALKRSASALFEGGNTLEESIGLITAANTVVQNPETVGTALKTLSLRIRGVKTELEEAGLETENMAETTAQLQRKLLALTNGKVDIMIDENNFKSTTQILREMSTVWEELTDVQQAAALELIGGKRQANILGSLISNFEIAEDAIATASNSAGSALRENEVYLDSIEGKTQILTNSLQNLWNNTVSSKGVKMFLDLANSIVTAIDKIGVLKVAVAGLVGFLTIRSGNDFGKIFQINTEKFKQTLLETKNLAESFKQSTVLTNKDGIAGLFFTKEGLQNIKQYIGGIREATKVTGLWAKISAIKTALTTKETAANVANAASVTMVGVASKAATIGVAALNAVLTMGLSFAITSVFMGVMSLVDNIIHRAENLKQEVDEIISSYNAAHSELMKNKADFDETNADSLVSKYAKLSKGVNELGQNVSLTADEYAEYQDVVNNLANQIPSLVSGYDAQGNAILSCKNNVDELVDAYERLVHVQNQKILSNSDKITKDFNNDVDKENSQGFWKGLVSGISNTPLLNISAVGLPFMAIDAFTDYKMTANAAKTLEELLNMDAKQRKQAIQKLEKSEHQTFREIESALKESGIDVGLTDGGAMKALEETFNTNPEKIRSIVNNFYSQFNNSVEDQKVLARAKLSEAFDISSEISGLNYSNISEDLQAIAYQLVNNLDYAFLSELSKTGKSVEEWITEILNQLNKISSSDKNTIETALDLQTQFNGGEISYGEYVKNVEKVGRLIDNLKLNDEVKKQIKLNLGLNEDGIVAEYHQLITRLTDDKNYAFEASITYKQAQNFVDDLKAEDIPIAMDVITELSENSLLKDIEKEFDELEKGGKVDLTVRPQVDTSELTKAGWEDAGEGVATLFTNTFANEAGNVAMNFTPILTDKNGNYVKTLSPEALTKYAEGVIEGVHGDYLKLQIGSEFRGEDAIEQAEKTAQHIHELQETYYVDARIDMKDIEDAFKLEKMLRGLNLEIDLGVESKGIEALNTALASSVSNAGLSSESMSALKERYSELEAQGWDLSNMFEQTSLGIHLNRQEFNKLEKELAKQKLDKVTNELTDMRDTYDGLGEAIRECDDPVRKSKLFSDRQLLAQRIGEAATLASQYRALASSYKQWLDVEEAGQERDMYEKVIEGFNNIEDEISRGWLDDGTIEFLELLTGKNLSTAPVKEQIKAYRSLDKEIKNTGYSISDFFTVNDDGESTSTGVYNFLRAVESLEKSKAFKKIEGIENLVKRDKNGNIVSFDFEIAGGDEAIAEALGISEELVQIILRAADDAGFVISLDGTYKQLADLQKEAQTAAKYLQEIGKTKFEFDFDTTSVSNIKTQLEEATGILKNKEFWNTDGTFNFDVKGATEAMTVVSTLQAKLDNLTQEKYGIGLTTEDEEFEEPLEKLQEYGETVAALNQLKLDPVGNTDKIDEFEKRLEKTARYFANLTDEMKVSIGLEADDNWKEVKKKIESGQVTIPSTLDIQTKMDKNLQILADLALYNSDLLSDEQKEAIKLKYNVEAKADKVETEQFENQVNDVVDKTLAENSREMNIELLAKMSGTEEVEEFTDKLDKFDSETIQIMTKIVGGADLKYLKGTLSEIFENDKETLEIIAKAIGEGDVESLKGAIESLDPKYVEAIAKAFGYDDVNGLYDAIDNLDSKTIQAIAEVFGIKDAETLVNVIGSLKNKNVVATATVAKGDNFDKNKQDYDNIKDKTVTVTTWFKNIYQNLLDNKKAKENGKQRGSTKGGKNKAGVNGTAHARGSWGTDKTETALVGELGPELVVSGDRWYTVGDDGAEFTTVPKGSIIFNHKQTEELLNNGHVTSRGKIKSGAAHAQGTAYSNGEGLTLEVKDNSQSVKKSGKSKTKKTSDYSSDFEEVFDWFEVRMEEIHEDLDLMSAKLENVISIKSQNNILDDIIKTHKEELKTLEKGYKLYSSYASDLLTKVPKAYRDEAKNGKIAIEEFYGKVDEKTLEAIKNYREWTQKAAGLKTEMEGVKRAIVEAAKQKFDNISDNYDNVTSLQDSRQQHYLDMADYREDKGWINSGKYYEAAMAEEKNQKQSLQNEKKKLQASLDESVKKGDIKKKSDEWYEMVNAIHAVDSELDECNATIEEYQNRINEIHFENFEKGLYRVSRLAEETQNLIDIMADKDVVNDDAEFTPEGMTQMGLYAQQMENYKKQSEIYAEEIDYVNKMYDNGDISFQEYLEKLDELKDGQYEAIQGYKDSKDAIVDLQKTRVDAIKEGIEREIEAYEELIDKKKEELSAEKDLYDFQKSIIEQKKSVADIERQIAALSGDNSASARAQRKKLEAELAQAQQDLQDNFYDRSVEKQQEALDSELEQFTELREKEMEGWDKWLEKVDAVYADAMGKVEASGTTIKDTIKGVANEWDLQINNKIKTPWENASTAIERTSELLDEVIAKFEKAVQNANGTASEQIKDQKDQNADITDEVKDKFQKGQKAYAKKGTKIYDSNGKAISQTSGNYGYTVVSTDNKTGLTKVKNYKGEIRYFKTSDLSETAFKDANPKDNGKDSAKTYPYGKASATSGNIGYGATGKSVKAIQWALKQLGYSIGKSGVDGSFGPDTLAAVKKFQKKMGIKVDGIVGKDTRKKFKAKGYATGTTGVKKDQWALIDELGEELVIGAENGRLTYLKKGSGVIPADLTSNLMDWGELNPQDVLDRNRPSIGASSSVHATEINLNIQYGDMLRIENFKGDNPEEIAKIVAKQFEKHTKDLNNSLRKYVR